MRSSAERFGLTLLQAVLCSGLLLTVAGCPYDLDIPPPPPAVSAQMRVAVTVVRDGPVKVSLTGTRTLDAAGTPALGSETIPQDEQLLQPVALGYPRLAQFDLPETAATFIHPGT